LANALYLSRKNNKKKKIKKETYEQYSKGMVKKHPDNLVETSSLSQKSDNENKDADF